MSRKLFEGSSNRRQHVSLKGRDAKTAPNGPDGKACFDLVAEALISLLSSLLRLLPAGRLVGWLVGRRAASGRPADVQVNRRTQTRATETKAGERIKAEARRRHRPPDCAHSGAIMSPPRRRRLHPLRQKRSLALLPAL